MKSRQWRRDAAMTSRCLINNSPSRHLCKIEIKKKGLWGGVRKQLPVYQSRDMWNSPVENVGKFIDVDFLDVGSRAVDFQFSVSGKQWSGKGGICENIRNVKNGNYHKEKIIGSCFFQTNFIFACVGKWMIQTSWLVLIFFLLIIKGGKLGFSRYPHLIGNYSFCQQIFVLFMLVKDNRVFKTVKQGQKHFFYVFELPKNPKFACFSCVLVVSDGKKSIYC